MQRARSLRERHTDASPSLVAVALAAATFADGPTGTSIRPGHARIAAITGLSVGRVNKLMQRLVKLGELRRDKPAWRGSAACYTWIGGMVVTEASPSEGMVVAQGRNGGALTTTHQSHPLEPSGPSRPSGGGRRHTCAEWDDFHNCAECGAYRWDDQARSY
jgi:hypothetical protein